MSSVKLLWVILSILIVLVWFPSAAIADDSDRYLVNQYQTPANRVGPSVTEDSPAVTPQPPQPPSRTAPPPPTPSIQYVPPTAPVAPAAVLPAPHPYLLPPVATEPMPPGTGPQLFSQGNYKAAYARFWTQLQYGEPEATFYSLVIRRNGLDGRSPANSLETAALWDILVKNGQNMRGVLSRREFSEETRNVYATALAHLIYYGETAPVWPPSIFRGTKDNSKGREAINIMRDAAHDFTPAMNFTAFLYFHPDNNSHKTSSNPTAQAVQAGDYLAMGNLAWLYREGYGVNKNYLRSVIWSRRGCNSNPPVSRNQNQVGYAYEVGLGVTVDLSEALIWYDKSAAQKYPPGQSNAVRLKNNTSSSSPALYNTLLF